MMDLDVVVYLNDVDFQDFHKFLSDLEDYIELSESYTNCKLLARCLTFVAEQTLHVDLLPATNRVPRSEFIRGKRAQEVQHEMTLSYLRDSKDPFLEGYNQSTGLSETAIEFVTRKNEKYHCSTMARLAKFWSKTVCVEGFHFGRSSIMEYIAIRSSEIEQSAGRENTMKTFRRFLEEISNPHEMSIYWTDYYPKENIPRKFETTRPLLVDPTNPYNNILMRGTTQFMYEMATFAEVSMERLEEAEHKTHLGQPVNLADLFKPQPEWVYLPFRLRGLKKPRNFSVSVRAGSGMMMPKTVIKSSMEKYDQETMENFLFCFTEVAVAGYKKRGIQNVALKLQRDVQRLVEPDAGWGSSMNKLEIPFTDEYDSSNVLIVTFDIFGDSTSCGIM